MGISGERRLLGEVFLTKVFFFERENYGFICSCKK